tara:strand:+ start:536 stop:727 length:192 start_codon:yes stop_codon:yes gene_type:complete
LKLEIDSEYLFGASGAGFGFLVTAHNIEKWAGITANSGFALQLCDQFAIARRTPVGGNRFSLA